ncbi:helix-turn-helix domain-containing protein [Nocardia cyriacigeorgica]|uniref:Helix-turn-helix domain-containing protein n=1 Tax=Nocardia cyriacigeorgica TaxID=135487 RepID=A0A5R8NB68_9NOCA|nr:helix-turn-helix domain-containing protein [Nocardia cyriacigeorgica]TLF72876.1 helix-turn-helix domain-containing protein [Nocardia cyriacigeorgica]
MPADRRRLSYEERKAEWVAKHIEKAPPLTEQQKQAIRTAFADLRRATAKAEVTEREDRASIPRSVTSRRIRYTKAEAAYQLSISVRTIDRLREEGKLIARRDGSRIYFDHSELESYAKSCPVEEGQ